MFHCSSFISNKEIKELKTTQENTNNIREQRAVAAEEALAALSAKLARLTASKTRSKEASEAKILQLQLDFEAAMEEHDAYCKMRARRAMGIRRNESGCRESHELTDQSQRVTESGIDQRSVVLTRSMPDSVTRCD